MSNEELKRDALRFLSQQTDRGNLHWAVPAKGIEAMAPEPVGQAVAEIENENCRRKPEDISQKSLSNASKPLEAVKMVKAQVKNGMAAVAASESGERGAPEPVPFISTPGNVGDPYPDFKNMEELNKGICNCKKCPLGISRNHFVFGIGDTNARLLLVGEAPGADEDATGTPFIGRAGKLLDQILAAVDMKRGEDVYIGNILKCRPPNNRDPQPAEVAECEPYLVKQIQLIKPTLIVALGRVAAQTLLRTKQSLTNLRGSLHDYHGVPLLVTYHPAALLRNPNWKRPTWEDVQWMKKILDEAGPKES